MANVSKKRDENKELKKNVKEVNKRVKSVKSSDTNIKKYEKYTCVVIGILIVLLLFAVLKNSIFIPAFLITVGLELFCVAYYFLEDKEKKNIVYGLFVMGVVLIIVALMYTIVNTI